MLGIPAPTEFDVRFRLLGIPVRVHPMFWVLSAGLGMQGTGSEVVIFMACVFLSVLVHEFGHALMVKLEGEIPEVILFWMGGVCVHTREPRSPWRRLRIVAMGPGFGLILFALVLALDVVLYGLSPREAMLGDFSRGNLYVQLGIYYLLQINLIWSLFNLIPMLPFDGGRILQILLEFFRGKSQATRWAHIISLVTAGSLAGYFFLRNSVVNALMLAFMAFLNFQALQAMHYQNRYGDSFEDEADWWKR